MKTSKNWKKLRKKKKTGKENFDYWGKNSENEKIILINSIAILVNSNDIKLLFIINTTWRMSRKNYRQTLGISHQGQHSSM